MKKIPKAWYLDEFIDKKTSKGKKTKLLKLAIKLQNRRNRYANRHICKGLKN